MRSWLLLVPLCALCACAPRVSVQPPQVGRYQAVALGENGAVVVDTATGETKILWSPGSTGQWGRPFSAMSATGSEPRGERPAPASAAEEKKPAKK